MLKSDILIPSISGLTRKPVSAIVVPRRVIYKHSIPSSAYGRGGNINVEKYLANTAIYRKSRLINPAKFFVGVGHVMNIFGVVILLSIETTMIVMTSRY